MVERSVKVMYKAVSVEHGFANDLLNSFSLEPWFTVSVIDRAVSSKERIELTKLVHLHVQVLTWHALIAWDVRTTKEHSRDTG